MTSTRSSKWVLFSALQREGRRMSVWLALFPFLGFLYALCHGLLQALMNQDTDTVAAQDQTVRIFGSIALFLSAATIMAGAFFAISAFRFLYSRRQSDFYLSLPVTRRTFYFVKWVIGELVLLLAFCGAGIGCWLVPQLIPRKWHVQLDAGYGLRLLAVALCSGGGLLLYLFAMRRYGWQGVAILDPAYRYRRLFAPGTDFLCRAVSRFPVRAEPAASTDCGTGQPYRVCALWGAGSV